MTYANETITAQVTPPGRGGVAIVRVSGPLVSAISKEILKQEIPPRSAVYLPFYDHDNTVLDEGLALFFPNPNSFTGEDVLELQGHGGPVVVDLILKRVLALGARMARPGEFSERAFLNGKMDLAQAEAVADLIDAASSQAARLAMRSLQGEFSSEVSALTEKVIHLRMYIEAAIDFTDEEIDFLADEKLIRQMKEIMSSLDQIQHNAKQGSFLREGITAVIAGAPNVGKSSLLNQLSGKDIAIVTDIPGTTRDVLRDFVLIDDIPMHIVDTAGLRESDDVVEQEGMRRAHKELENADIVLSLLDASRPEFEINLPSNINCPVINVRNKIDIIGEQPSVAADTISISAKTGAGLDLLKQHIKKIVGVEQQSEGIYLARRRHLDALTRARDHVDAAHTQLASVRAGELAAEDLRLAQLSLSEITGEFTADDLLGRIFSSFCIGK
ncbi:MAG TPA: tRNA uridine-5-carboxymethylaminomethyl(34) synthesis GTPase MnmE [Gammaproteobacteria bacterium]|nr:tRNA uridine-5-carboxymethylaminomethyl(34) synthesis GTPase MnmE [Gammaproteobacteria bacterium]